MPSKKSSDDEHEDEPPGCLGSPATAQVNVAALSDQQLLYYFYRIHHPDIVAEEWIETLQAEVARRGLRHTS